METAAFRSLTKALKEWENDGLIIRRDHNEIPPSVECSLSPRGIAYDNFAKTVERIHDVFFVCFCTGHKCFLLPPTWAVHDLQFFLNFKKIIGFGYAKDNNLIFCRLTEFSKQFCDKFYLITASMIFLHIVFCFILPPHSIQDH